MSILRALALDALAWYAAPAAFLWIYVQRHLALERKRAWRRQVLASAAVGIRFRWDIDPGPCGAIGCP
jgi:hypothetical protein